MSIKNLTKLILDNRIKFYTLIKITIIMRTTKFFKAMTLFWWLAVLLTVAFGGGIIFGAVFGEVGESIAGIAIALLIMCPFAFVDEQNPLLENIKSAIWIGWMFYFGILSMYLIGWFIKTMFCFNVNVICTILIGLSFLAVLDIAILLLVWLLKKIFKKNNTN